MKLKFPAEAFALGIILFSAGMKEAFLCGVLTVWAAVLAAFLTNLLDGRVPVWSLRSSVLVMTGAFTAAAFRWEDFALGLADSGWAFAVSGGLVGLLAAKGALQGGWGSDYGELCAQSGLCWGLWVLCGALREFLTSGEVFSSRLAAAPFQSSAFGGAAYGFLAAGIILGIVCAAAKGQCAAGGLLVALPAVCLIQPFRFPLGNALLGAALAAGVTLVFFASAKITLAFSRTAPALRRLPVELLAMGIVWMVLGVF